MLPRAALNMGVKITVTARAARKNVPNDKALYGVPLMKNADRCQMPHVSPGPKGLRNEKGVLTCTQ